MEHPGLLLADLQRIRNEIKRVYGEHALTLIRNLAECPRALLADHRRFSKGLERAARDAGVRHSDCLALAARQPDLIANQSSAYSAIAARVKNPPL